LALLALLTVLAAALIAMRMRRKQPGEEVNSFSLDTIFTSATSPLYVGRNETYVNELYQPAQAKIGHASINADTHRITKESWDTV
jgi:hypothetical protein